MTHRKANIAESQLEFIFSDIPTSSERYFHFVKAILKPYGFSDIIFAAKAREANIAVRSTISLRSNITRRKANIAEKSKSCDLLFSWHPLRESNSQLTLRSHARRCF